MRKLGLWGGWAVLLLALGAAVVSAGPPADDDDDAPAKVAGPDPAARPRDGWNPFLTRLFGQDEKKPAPKPTKNADADKADKKADAPAPRPSAREEIAAGVIRREKENLRRRQEVCLRLREIARDTQDDALEQKAIQLDQLAFEIYEERVQRLAGGASDEERLNAPGKKRDGTAEAGRTASVREVRP